MAKRILLDALVKVFGEFIELSEENFDLNLAVWSGQISLHDLKLRTHNLLRSFDLSIVHGTIGKLEVTIPWTALLNSPVKVVIDGLYLQVGPLNVAALDKEETKNRVMEAKMQKLRMVDKFIDFSAGENGSVADDESEDGESSTHSSSSNGSKNTRATLVQQLTTKIIDNLEITLKNVHIRYEDSQTIPGTPFSAGITLNSFTLSTCDEKWHERYVARDINLASTSIRKLAKLHNFGLYWMTKSVVFSDQNFKEWSKSMQDLIYPGDGTTNGSGSGTTSIFDTVQYILHPANSLTVRHTHNERSLENLPKFDMVVESTDLPLSIDRAQFLQLLRTCEMIGVVERKRQPFSYRPYERPNSPENRRAWWRYACKLVIKRRRYIQLVRMSKTVDEHTGMMDVRNLTDRIESRELEERMPLRALVIFRHAAAREMQNEAKARTIQQQHALAAEDKAKRAAARAAGKGTWWGWLGGLEKEVEGRGRSDSIVNTDSDGSPSIAGSDGSSVMDKNAATAASEEEDVSIASIITSLEKQQQEEGTTTTSATMFRLSLTTSASINFFVLGMPVASATAALSVLMEVTTWGVVVTAHMKDLLLVDQCTPNPPIKHIAMIKRDTDINNVAAAAVASTGSAKTGSNSGFSVDGSNGSATVESENVLTVVCEIMNGRTGSLLSLSLVTITVTVVVTVTSL